MRLLGIGRPLLLTLQLSAAYAAKGICTDGATGCDVDFQCRGCNTKSTNRGHPCASDDNCKGGGDAKCSGSAFVGSGACAITAEEASADKPPPTPSPTQGRKKSRQPDIRTFEILTSGQIHTTLGYLAEEYPSFVALTDAQTEYGLPAAGTEDDCPFDRTEDFLAGCRNYILTIEDKAAHPVGSPSWQTLPEVFLVGAMDGTDRIGPTTLIEVAALLLEAASCESMSTQDSDPDTSIKAEICREQLSEKGVPHMQRKWLARLVTTRRIVFLPMANALGYYREEKEEDGADPAHDFPFDIKPEDAHTCMRTVAGRTVNELFREHMFQLGVSFQSGGMASAITYEWGAATYSGSISPDDEAQAEIAKALSDIAGKFNDVPSYRQGARSGGRGEMEDWAYAGSWDPDRVVQCTPVEYGGYTTEKTIYDDSMLRTLTTRVDYSNGDSPDNDLGTTEDLLYAEGAGNGHIARNIKLSLLAIQLVEPYVSIVGANGVLVTDDIVPATDRTGRSCTKTKVLLVPQARAENVAVEWTVGGGFTVDSSDVYHVKWDDLPDFIDGSTHPTDEEWQSLGDLPDAVQVSPSRGRTKWHKDGPTPSESTLHPFGSSFDAQIDISMYSPGDRVAVFAVAKLDGGWKEGQPADVKPVVPPQSHLVNARTNSDWRHESSYGKVIQGRFNWYSIPLTLVISDDQGDGGATVELSSRLNDVSSSSADYGSIESGGRAESNGVMRRHLVSAAVAFGVLVFIVGAIFLVRTFGWIENSESDNRLVEMDFNMNVAPRRQSGDALRFMEQALDIKNDNDSSSTIGNSTIQSRDFAKDNSLMDSADIPLDACDPLDNSKSSAIEEEDDVRSLNAIFWDRPEVSSFLGNDLQSVDFAKNHVGVNGNENLLASVRSGNVGESNREEGENEARSLNAIFWDRPEVGSFLGMVRREDK